MTTAEFHPSTHLPVRPKDFLTGRNARPTDS